MSFIKFADWLGKREPTSEMTSSASVGGGGGTYTGDIARFARPLQLGDDEEEKKTHLVRRGNKAKKEDYPSTTD